MPEDQAVVVVPVDVLQSLLQEVHSLREEVQELKVTVANQDAYIEARFATVDRIEKMQSKHSDRLGLLKEEIDITWEKLSGDICNHGQRIVKLEEEKQPQPMQKDRAEILRALLAANGGKMLAKEARQKMHLSKNRFSELLKTCDFLDTKPLHSDRRKDVIILKPELVPWN